MGLHSDITIIGGGPVGLFCGFQAGMFGMRATVIDALPEVGGQCTALYPEKPIYDIPGYSRILARELIEQLEAQAAPFQPRYILSEQVIKLEEQPDAISLTTNKGTHITTGSVIIAAGGGALQPKRPPIPGIEGLESKAVFYSVKDPAQFRNRKVVIAGGGDSAVDWALLLADIANKVYVVHRRAKFRAAEQSIQRLSEIAAANPAKVEIVIPYQLHNVLHDAEAIKSIEVIDLDGGTRMLEANTLIPCFGLENELGPLQHWGLALEEHRIKVQPHSMQTNIERLYAIGDIATYPGKLKLILTGFAEAAVACHHAREVIHPGQAWHFEYSTTRGVPGAA